MFSSNILKCWRTFVFVCGGAQTRPLVGDAVSSVALLYLPAWQAARSGPGYWWVRPWPCNCPRARPLQGHLSSSAQCHPLCGYPPDWPPCDCHYYNVFSPLLPVWPWWSHVLRFLFLLYMLNLTANKQHSISQFFFTTSYKTDFLQKVRVWHWTTCGV